MDQDEFLDEVMRLTEQGWSKEAIARELGISQSRVERAVKALAATPGGKPALSSPTARRVQGIFVGRRREMDELQAALDDVLSGVGRLVMLAGEPGIGKTRTAEELSIVARRRDARVIWGRCYDDHGVVPYWPWIQVIRSCLEYADPSRLRSDMGAGAGDIATIVPELRERIPELKSPAPLEDPEQARFRLFDSITAFLRNTARSEPVVLVLENLHWSDRPSLLLLEFLAQELDKLRLLVVGTYRDADLSRQHPLSETLGELVRQRPFQRVSLRGLTREDVHQFVASATGITPSPGLAAAIWSQTDGNPLFMTEVVRLLMQEGMLIPDPPTPGGTGEGEPRWTRNFAVPEGIRQVIGRRLNRLSPQCNQMLSIASVMGREFNLMELGYLMEEQSEDSLLQLLEEAAGAHIIEESPDTGARYRFSHALVRETLRDELTAARRVRFHRRVGRMLESVYAANLTPHLGRLAYHFFEAVHSGDVKPAVEYAVRAAERANSLVAYEEAVHYYDMALQSLELSEPVDDYQRCRLLVALGEAQRKSGDIPSAIAAFQQAADASIKAGTPETLAHAALGLEESTFQWALPSAPAIRLLEEAGRRLPQGDSAPRARTLAALARATGAFAPAGSQDEAVALSREATGMARRLNDPSVLAATMRISFQIALASPDSIDERLNCAHEILRLAEQCQDQHLLLIAHHARVIVMLELGDIQEAVAEATATVRLGEQVREPFYNYIGAVIRAMLAILEGRFDEGESLAQEAVELGGQIRGRDVSGVFGVQMFTLRREQGRLAGLEPVLRNLVDHAQGSLWQPGLALIYSELGLQADARSEFERLARDDFAGVPRDSLWLYSMANLAEVCSFLGDARHAATLYQLLLPYQGRTVVASGTTVCCGAASYYLGLLATTMGHWDKAEGHFQHALALNHRMGARPRWAHTQHQYSEMLLARNGPGDRQRAVALLEEALATSRELGMGSLEGRIIARVSQMEAPREAPPVYPDGLSQREVAVLRLITVGRSNQEIAEELIISRNTVANHVKNILTKTGAINRTEAAAYAVRHSLAPSADLPDC